MDAAAVEADLRRLVTAHGTVDGVVWNRVKDTLLIDQWTLDADGYIEAEGKPVPWQAVAQAPVYVGYVVNIVYSRAQQGG